MSEVSARERIILAVDTSEEDEASRLVGIAREAGARFVKLGLELSSATSWKYCSQLSAANELEWVADAKIDDIPNTVAATVRNLRDLEYPPFAITIHTTAGEEAMQKAQQEAGDIKVLGVTVLTSISAEAEGEEESEGERIFHVPVKEKVMELARDAARAGLKGIVASPQEVREIKTDPKTKHLFAMIPGTRSPGAEKGDQARPTTPAEAIRAGADLLVIGRQVSQAKDPAKAYNDLVAEIEGALGESDAT